MKKLIATTLSLKVKTITTNFCFQVDKVLNYDEQSLLRQTLLKDFGIVCLYMYADKTIIKF